MHQGKYIFNQIISLLSQHTFDQCVHTFGGDHRIKKLSCWQQFLVMAFGQLGKRESLRDICSCLAAHQSKLYHLGLSTATKRSTLQDANEIRDYRTTTWWLASYMVGFTVYWFFIATHLVRFLDTASVMLVMLSAIGVTMLKPKLRWLLIGTAGTVMLTIGLYFGALRSTANILYTSFLPHILRSNEVSYTLGKKTKLEYLQQSPILDCGYSALDYLQRNDPTAHVLDNWTEWHNYHFKFYNQSVEFYALPPDLTAEEVTTYAATNAIEYIYFSTISKADFPNNSTDYVREYYAQRSSQEQQLLDHSLLLFSFDSCELYQLTPASNGLDQVGLAN